MKVTVDQFIEQCNQIGIDPVEAVSRMEAREMGKDSAPAGRPELREKILAVVLECDLPYAETVEVLDSIKEEITEKTVRVMNQLHLQEMLTRYWAKNCKPEGEHHG